MATSPRADERRMMSARRPATAATVLFFTSLAALLDSAITVEWSTPLCTRAYRGWSGPIGSVYGFPLPYERPSIAFSLHHDVLLGAYVIDIALLALALFACLHVVARRFPPRAFLAVALAALGLALAVVGCRAALLWHPARSISYGPEERYSQFRPVGLVGLEHTDCTPSAFWFGTE